MDIHDRYTYEIQHECALLKTGKANYAILSQLSEYMSYGKTIATIVQYEDEQY